MTRHRLPRGDIRRRARHRRRQRHANAVEADLERHGERACRLLHGIAIYGRIEVPDLVAVMPPEPFASFMVERGYVGRDVPILKHVVGLPGQRVATASCAITVDDVPLGEARDRDSRGRDLLAWQGCRVIADGELSS